MHPFAASPETAPLRSRLGLSWLGGTRSLTVAARFVAARGNPLPYGRGSVCRNASQTTCKTDRVPVGGALPHRSNSRQQKGLVIRRWMTFWEHNVQRWPLQRRCAAVAHQLSSCRSLLQRSKCVSIVKVGVAIQLGCLADVVDLLNPQWKVEYDGLHRSGPAARWSSS